MDRASPAAVPGLTRSDPRGAGISRTRSPGQNQATSFSYATSDGKQICDLATLARISSLAIPPAWTNVWISPDPLGHIQATGTDSRGRTQYRYHQFWREQRDTQKFDHMLRFAAALPALRAATLHDMRLRDLGRDRVSAAAVRLIDLGLFRLGGERYAELDHHYGAATLEKRHVSLHRESAVFDYVAKEGKRRTVIVADKPVLATLHALVRSDNNLDALFCFSRSVVVGWSEGCRWSEGCSRDHAKSLRKATTLRGAHDDAPGSAGELSGQRQPSATSTAMFRDNPARGMITSPRPAKPAC